MQQYAIAFVAAVMAGNAAAADAQQGKQLHEERCTKCHDDSVYKREDRFISSREALQKQVSRCAVNTGAQWFDDEVADVVEYLDTTYYNFE